MQVEVKRERHREEEASKAAIAETYDEVQVGIDVDALFIGKLQLEERDEYTIKEKAMFVAETIDAQRKFRATQRSSKIRKIQGFYERRKRVIDDFKPIDSDDTIKDSKEAAGVNKQEVLEEPNSTKVEVKQEGHEESIRKRPGRRLKMKATKKSKRQKTDADLEEEEQLKAFLKIVPDEEGIIDYEVLEKRFPIINWESKFYDFDRHGAECIYYRIFRSDGSSRWIKTFSKMVTRFDRLDLEELYNLVMKRFETTTPEGVDLVLWGDLRIMFDANAEDELWQNQERWNLKSWDLYENCGVHTLILEDGTEIHMLAERKYPLQDFIKELASPKQTALDKDISNPLIVDSLLKTIWLSMHLVIVMKHWLFQIKRLLGRIVGFQKFLQLSAATYTSYYCQFYLARNIYSDYKYVAEILKKFNFTSVKTASTPIETQKPLTKDEEADDVDIHLYRSMIGSLMYLAASRPDIMFAVCACSRFQVTPKTSHLNVVKRIFRYLKGKPKLGLWYPRVSSFDLEAYSDSDYARANLDRKSTTGGCQFLSRRLISWQCKKQTIIATSITEAEYVAAANCCRQVLWIQNQMLDYGFNFMNTKIYIDNESTICIVKNPVFHSKTKHIEIRHHFIKDAYEKKLIKVLKIHTNDNVADLLTKAFDGRQVSRLPCCIVCEMILVKRWNLKSWDLYENCGVHTLILEDGTEIHMLAERKYLLTRDTLERMLSLRLVAGTASEDAYTLLRFIQKHIDEYGSHDGGDDPIACLNKAMAFLTTIASSRFPSTNNQLRTSLNPRNKTTIQDDKVRVVKCYNCQGKGHMAWKCTQPKRPRNAAWYKKNAMLAEAQEAGQILNEEQLAFLVDLRGSRWSSSVLMANISNYGSDVISEVPHSETYLNDMENQSLLAMQDFEQPPVVDITDNEIHITAELESYKEQVKIFEQRLNIDLSSRKKMIDSQMDDMIQEKLALKEQVDSLEQNLSKQIKEKECLLQTFTIFKSESKEKEDKYVENEIDLEKKIIELDNIIFQVGYQNPFHLKKAQRIKPTLYDGIGMSDKHVAMPVIDDEETLILEENSRSKMSEKAKDPEIINKNISHKPIDYEKLNRLSEDFRKCFTPQQEMDAEQVFWLRISNPTSKPFDASLVKIEAPKELPKVSLVNESLKKLKFHLARFNNVVKIRTTLDARTEEREETCNLEAELLKSQNAFNDLLKRHSQLEKHCISLECSIQLNQEIFQKRESCDNQNALEIPEFFAYNDLKAQLQDKDSTICKLKDMIKSMREKSKDENIKYDYCEIETKNLELENIEQVKAENPLDKELDLACKHAQQIQELLVYVRDTCPNAITLNAKKVVVTPKNKVKKVRFAEPLTSSSNSKQVESSKTSDSNTLVLTSTGLKCSTSKCGSKPTSNKRNDRISQTPSRNMKNKVEAQPRTVNKNNCVVKPVHDVNNKHSLLHANSEPVCPTCKKSLFDGVHDICFLDFMKNVNSRAKSAKKHKKENI
ncbi:retrovirus-related pol polyprotein from transposon TNT 1-94 [Tanacetum coccineum]